ncbi:MAG: retroviral-like aspartic protease family protein, partial [Flavobacteriaceae bacterium]|nr:retroviral-like aspartic protease family protein [Flavobacteriaceae bacterium]
MKAKILVLLFLGMLNIQAQTVKKPVTTTKKTTTTTKTPTKITPKTTAVVEGGQTTIYMQKEGGVFTIPCTVNGIKLKFIFDTGASDVSISLTEANFMLKNGYLKNEDILGKENYRDATGNISEGTKINIRKIEFEGYTLYNVKASIVHTLSAPLLLGQTAMAKLGKFQLDPNNGTLTILGGTNIAINNSSTISKNSTNPNNIIRPIAPAIIQKSIEGIFATFITKKGTIVVQLEYQKT